MTLCQLARWLREQFRKDEDEERRRRGASGWQKATAPPKPGKRPGGLPPKREEMPDLSDAFRVGLRPGEAGRLRWSDMEPNR